MIPFGGGRLALFFAVIFDGAPAPVSQRKVVPPVPTSSHKQTIASPMPSWLFVHPTQISGLVDSPLSVFLFHMVGLQVSDFIKPLFLHAPTL
jgi:hypothetical protein